MSRRCTTHFLACGCRERRFAKLEEENERLEAQLYEAVKDLSQLKAAREGYATTLDCEVGDVHEKLREVLGLLAEAREALECPPRPTEVCFHHEDGYERYRHWWHWTRNKALAGQGGEG